MIEILPNWHPIFVHFTVALFSTSVAFYVLSVFARKLTISSEFLIVAQWCLWVCALATVATILAGFYAYYTVSHDAPSHAAMTNHRNWAIPTSIVIIVLALWSWLKYRTSKLPSIIFLTTMLVGTGLLMTTAWKGGELVYRYGLGVMSIPQSSGKGHEHDESNQHKSTTTVIKKEKKRVKHNDNHTH